MISEVTWLDYHINNLTLNLLDNNSRQNINFWLVLKWEGNGKELGRILDEAGIDLGKQKSRIYYMMMSSYRGR